MSEPVETQKKARKAKASRGEKKGKEKNFKWQVK